MISTGTATLMMGWAFLSEESPFFSGGDWFTMSLHTEAVYASSANELPTDGTYTYQRVRYGGGPDWWALGGRSVSNKLEIAWPATASGGEWPPVRAVALWGGEGSELVWSVPLNHGAAVLSSGDRLVIPPGGLVLGFG